MIKNIIINNMSTVFDSLIDRLHSSIEKKAEDLAALPQKTKRPLKMPKNYDFSVRNVDWTQYKDDYVLRTDAVCRLSRLIKQETKLVLNLLIFMFIKIKDFKFFTLRKLKRRRAKHTKMLPKKSRNSFTNKKQKKNLKHG